MKRRVIVASGNQGKIEEIREILAELDLEVVSMKDAGVELDVEETGSSFEENAMLKARGIAQLTDDLVIADDSGLEIDYLNREPGIYSARYLGRDVSYDIKNQNLLDRMEGVPDEKRTARFVCAVAAVLPNKKELVVRGIMEGMIGYEIKGEHGFGYDPIFFLPEYGMTSAEILPEEKNRISHRGKALQKMFELLKKEKI
jgi:XTP/dITP diphosphohydrolase